MARIRSVKPEFFTSEDVSVLPLRARLTWIGLWTQCDDHGRTKDQARLIKAAVWPLDDVSLRDVEEDLAILAGKGRIVRYQAENNRYLAVVKWHYHQKPNRPGKPKYPAPRTPVSTPEPDEEGHCALCWVLFVTHGGLTEDSVPVDNSTMDVSAGKRPNGSVTEHSLSQHGGLTPVGEGRSRGEEGGRASPRDKDQRPPARCPKHLNHPDPPNCGACRDTRLAAEAWDAEQPQRDAARRAAIRACPYCDGQGSRYEFGRRIVATPYQRCDHTPPEKP